MDAKKENSEVKLNESEVYDEELEFIESLPDTLDEKTLRKRELVEMAKKIGEGALWIVFAFLLGNARFLFGAAPFGVALLCAASSKLGYIYIGLAISSFVNPEGALVYFAAYTATLLIRVISRIVIDNPWSNVNEDELPKTLGEILPAVFSEHIFLRMATSCIGAFIIGIYKLIAGGFLFYDLWGVVAAMILAPVCVLLYSNLSGIREAGLSVSQNKRFAAICALAASLVLSFKDITVAGASLSLFATMLITLYFSRRHGIMYGLVAGTVCGLVTSPMLAPLFAFAALASGVMWGVSPFFAALCACSVGLAWGLYIEGISALTGLFPAIFAASLIFAVVDKLYFAERLEKESEEPVVFENVQENLYECTVLGKDAMSSVVLDDAEKKMSAMCETFSSLSDLFYNLSEKMRVPSGADLKQICDNAFDSCCHGCEMRHTCWEKEYSSSLAAVGKLCSSLAKKGRISEEDVAPRMYERCSAMPQIIEQINANSASHMQQLIIGDKTEIFALDYESISELLGAAISGNREDFEYSEELSRRACDQISEARLPLQSIFAYQNERQKSFVAYADNVGTLCAERERLQNILEEVSGTRLSCEIKEDERRGAYAVFKSERAFVAEYAKRSIKAEGEEGFCGDTVNIFEGNNNRFYSFISDGMGCGRDAALTSGICSVFLSKVLCATGECEISLKMLNGFLRNKGSGSMHECSATVDLMELDLLEGKASFYKGGAAPSYVFRDGNLFKLRSNTVPLGIIKELDTKKIALDVGDGDIIVMVSDGVTQSKEECPWLFDLLKANVGKESLASIADMIVRRAKYEGASDDISVVVIKVSRNV